MILRKGELSSIEAEDTQRDVRRVVAARPEYITFEVLTDGSGAFREMRLRTHVKTVRSVSVAHIREKADARAVPAAGCPRWDSDGQEIVLYGIGGLSATTRYVVTLRVEGEVI